MRITGGVHRSRKLFTPKNGAIRPTSDKVRQAVFNMLHARDVVSNAIVLDAFCGTGALGLEALSQGADHCIFFDKNRDSLSLCRQNIELLAEQECTDLILQDASKPKERPEKYLPATLVFLDPPYNKNLIPITIQNLFEKNWLSPDAFFVIETSKNETIFCDLVTIENQKIYGDTKIILATLNQS